MRHLLRFSLLFLLLSSISLARVQRDGPTLQLGTSTSRTIARGQTARFSIALDKEQFAHIVVDQWGVDLLVRVGGPKLGSLLEFDSANGANGPEHVAFVALEPGTYVVDVLPLSQSDNVSGRYEIRTVEVRAATDPEIREALAPETLKRRSVALLTMVAELLPQIRDARSRLRYQIQTAALLWPEDEKLARTQVSAVMAGVREYLDNAKTGVEPGEFFNTANELRQEVLQLLSPRDPESALFFLRSTAVADNLNSGTGYDQELRLELSLANQIARKEPMRASQIAEASLSRGYSYLMGNVISELRQSSPVLAAKLTKALVAKLQQEETLLGAAEASNVALTVLRFTNSPAARNPPPNGVIAPSETVLLSPLEQRALLGKILAEGLAYVSTPGAPYSPETNSIRSILSSLKAMPDLLRSYAPGTLPLIEEKFSQLSEQTNPWSRYQETINQNINNPEVALQAVSQAPPDIRDSLYQQIAQRLARVDGNSVRARDVAMSRIVNPQIRLNTLSGLERDVIYSLADKRRYDEAMSHIASMEPGRDRNNMVINVASRMGYGQGVKQDAAIRILDQARSLLGVPPRSESQEHMNALFQIASAYAPLDSRRGFELVELYLDQINDLCNAAVVLNGFNQEYYRDGEFLMTNGNSIGSIANQLNQALGRLAVFDFDRARTDVDRLQRPEIRVAAYLAIAQQVMSSNAAGQIRRRFSDAGVH